MMALMINALGRRGVSLYAPVGERPCEHKTRRQLSTGQEESSHRSSAALAPDFRLPASRAARKQMSFV